MHFKLIIIMVEDERTKTVIDAARAAGATGCTVLDRARGEGVSPVSSFFGISVDSQIDVILLLAEEHQSRNILEHVSEVGEFDETSGAGMAFQLDVEDAIGVRHQIATLSEQVENSI